MRRLQSSQCPTIIKDSNLRWYFLKYIYSRQNYIFNVVWGKELLFVTTSRSIFCSKFPFYFYYSYVFICKIFFLKLRLLYWALPLVGHIHDSQILTVVSMRHTILKLLISSSISCVALYLLVTNFIQLNDVA